MIERAGILASGLMVLFALGPLAAQAQDVEEAFLSDYSKLHPARDNPFDESYIAPDAQKRVGKYTAIMVDQPELFIHPASKYQGMKPDDMKAVADALRDAVTAELKDAYRIVDAPGANVLQVRVAVGDLLLRKKKLGTPPTDATSQIDFNNMKIEVEVLDSVTLEQFGALTTSRGSLKVTAADQADKPVSWDELKSLFGLLGKRLRCRLDNAHVSESAWQSCGTIGLASSTP